MSSPQSLLESKGAESMTQDADGSAEAKADPPEKNENWSFIEPQPIREDQVHNAVKFLSHSKVQGSPIEHRRSFLERKGLNKEEIDEAFRRVPDPPTRSRNDVIISEGRYTPLPPSQAQSGGLQQAVVPAQQQPAVQQIVGAAPPAMVQAHTKPSLLKFVLGVGFLAAAGAGTGVLFQRVLVPKLKAWIRAAASENSVEQRKQKTLSPVEEAAGAAAAAANTAAIAAAEVAGTYREMLKSRTEEWQHLTSIIKSLENQTQELKSALLSMATVSQDTNVPRQIPLAKGNLEGPAHKASIKSFGGTTSLLDQPQEMGHDQVINSITKIETSNGNLRTLRSSNLLSARSPADEGWNQGSTSTFLQGKAAAYTNHSSRINTFKDEPWWRNKKVEAENFTSSEQPAESTVQITEIDAISDGDSSVIENSSTKTSAGGETNSGPSTLGWAPPPVPQTVMPGAAAAIRYRKTVTNDDSKSALEEKVAPFQSSSGQLPEATIIEQEAPSLTKEALQDDGQERVLSEETKTYADVVKEEP